MLIERITVSRVTVHNSLFQQHQVHQPANTQSHSIETAALIVDNNVVSATDSGFVSALVLLDLSAAFDRWIIAYYCMCSRLDSVLLTVYMGGFTHTFPGGHK